MGLKLVPLVLYSTVLIIVLTYLDEYSCFQLDTDDGKTGKKPPGAAPSTSKSMSAGECSSEGLFPLPNKHKFKYCFKLSDQLNLQITDCPRGLCFNPSSSCCEASGCGHGKGSPKPDTITSGRKSSGSGGKASDASSGLSGGKVSKRERLAKFTEMLGSGALSKFQIPPYEMSYLHPKLMNEQKDKVCGSGVHCTQPGKYPNTKDSSSSSYYVCMYTGFGFAARWVKCPKNTCFRKHRCSRRC